METVTEILSLKLRNAALLAFPELKEDPQGCPVDLTQSTKPEFGHYQYNSAMKLAKQLRKNPRLIAEEICKKLDLSGHTEQDMLASVEVAGPGFINLTLSAGYLSNRVQGMWENARMGVSLPERPPKVVMDFSSPNIAKEMHVGHLRSTIIGDSIARLMEFLGYDVLRLNHVGDWGTAFGMLIHYLKENHPQVLTGEAKTGLSELVAWYRESKKLFDEDENFKKASQREVVSLQQGDTQSRRAWEVICEISREAYGQIYALLDVKLEERGESFYNPMIPEVLQHLEEKGMVRLSEGAKCIFLEGFKNREGDPLPLMVQKSDGGYNYATTDMACIRHRVQEEKADRLIYVTDQGQATHFKMIFEAAQQAGYLDPARVQANHVGFGLVLGPDGKKFKTRSGDSEKLIDLLSQAVSKAKEILMERNSDWSTEEIAAVSEALGIGAVKYADLSCNRMSDYTFSYDRMLRFEGNTAAFILYSYVRVNGIKKKVGVSEEELKSMEGIQLEHPSEVALGMHLCQFHEALESMEKELLPNRLTDYLFELAEKFNAFFRDCRVEGSEAQQSRLLLCDLVAKVLKQGLTILGVQTVERM